MRKSGGGCAAAVSEQVLVIVRIPRTCSNMRNCLHTYTYMIWSICYIIDKYTYIFIYIIVYMCIYIYIYIYIWYKCNSHGIQPAVRQRPLVTPPWQIYVADTPWSEGMAPRRRSWRDQPCVMRLCLCSHRYFRILWQGFVCLNFGGVAAELLVKGRGGEVDHWGGVESYVRPPSSFDRSSEN